MRSEFENSLGHTDGFHDGYVKWNELSNQYESSDEDYLDVAEWMNGALAIYEKRQTKVDELQKRVDAAKQLIEDLNKCYQQDHQNKFEYWRGFADSAGILGKRLEQALKGDQ